MNVFALSLFAITALAASQGTHVRGNGILKQEMRKVGNFTKIQVGGAVEVQVKVGPSPSLRIEAESNILPLYKTTVQGGTLTVHHKDGVSTTKPIKLWITVPSLKGVNISGASEMTITNLKTPKFDVEVSGASNLTAMGSADNLNLSASGASELNLLKLSAKSARVDASGASQIDLSVSSKLSGDVSGASEIAYRGKPTTSVSTSGASSVRALK
jgi:hypothetical protein